MPPRAQHRRGLRTEDGSSVAGRGSSGWGRGGNGRYYADEELFWQERSSDIFFPTKDNTTDREGTATTTAYATDTTVVKSVISGDDSGTRYAQTRSTDRGSSSSRRRPDADGDSDGDVFSRAAGRYRPRTANANRTPFDGGADRGSWDRGDMSPERHRGGVSQLAAALPYPDRADDVLDCRDAAVNSAAGSNGRPARALYGILGVSPERGGGEAGVPAGLPTTGSYRSSDRRRKSGVADSSGRRGRDGELEVGGAGAGAAAASASAAVTDGGSGAARASRAEELVGYGVAAHSPAARETPIAKTPFLEEDQNCREAGGGRGGIDDDDDNARRRDGLSGRTPPPPPQQRQRSPQQQQPAAAAAVSWSDTAPRNSGLAARQRGLEREGLERGRRQRRRRREAEWRRRRSRSLRDAEKVLDGVLESVEAGLSSDVCSGGIRSEVGARWEVFAGGRRAWSCMVENNKWFALQACRIFCYAGICYFLLCFVPLWACLLNARFGTAA